MGAKGARRSARGAARATLVLACPYSMNALDEPADACHVNSCARGTLVAAGSGAGVAGERGKGRTRGWVGREIACGARAPRHDACETFQMFDVPCFVLYENLKMELSDNMRLTKQFSLMTKKEMPIIWPALGNVALSAAAR